VSSNPGSLAARVAAAGRRCSLTGSPLDGWGTRGTPRQAGCLAERLEAECASRDASRRAQMPGRCALPQAKTFDGHDWGSVAWPDSLGRGGCRPPPSSTATRTSCPWATSEAAGRTCRGRCARSAVSRCARRGSSRRPPWSCGPGGRVTAGRSTASLPGSRGRSCLGSTSSASCRPTRAAGGRPPGPSRGPADGGPSSATTRWPWQSSTASATTGGRPGPGASRAAPGMRPCRGRGRRDGSGRRPGGWRRAPVHPWRHRCPR